MSWDTLLAAANFVEGNRIPPADDLTREDVQSENALDNPISSQDALSVSFEGRETRNRLNAETTSRDVGGANGASGNGSTTRQLHNRLEKNRRAFLKECFNGLKRLLPAVDEKRSSHLDVLRMAIEFVRNLKEKAFELEKKRHHLEVRKLSLQRRLASDTTLQLVTVQKTYDRPTADTAPRSPSTDTAEDSPIVSDEDDDDNREFRYRKILSAPRPVPVASLDTGIVAPPANFASCSDDTTVIKECNGLRAILGSPSACITACTETLSGGVTDVARRRSDAAAILAGLHSNLGTNSTSSTSSTPAPSIPTTSPRGSQPPNVRSTVLAAPVQLNKVSLAAATVRKPSLLPQHSRQTVAVQLLQQTLQQKSASLTAARNMSTSCAADAKVLIPSTLPTGTRIILPSPSQDQVPLWSRLTAPCLSPRPPATPQHHIGFTNLVSPTTASATNSAPSLVTASTIVTSAASSVGPQYILAFDCGSQLPAAASIATPLSSTPIPTFIGTFPGGSGGAAGRFILCPTVNGFPQLLPSTLQNGFTGGYSLLCGASGTATVAQAMTSSQQQPQTIPVLQLMQTVPVMQHSVGMVPMRSIVSTGSDGSSTLFVLPN